MAGKKWRPLMALDEQTIELLKRAHEGAQRDYVVERGGKKVASFK